MGHIGLCLFYLAGLVPSFFNSADYTNIEYGITVLALLAGCVGQGFAMQVPNTIKFDFVAESSAWMV